MEQLEKKVDELLVATRNKGILVLSLILTGTALYFLLVLNFMSYIRTVITGLG